MAPEPAPVVLPGSSPNQDSPFGPDYILQASVRPEVRTDAVDAPKQPEPVERVQKKVVAGVVPFASASGPATDLAALPPLEPLGTEALTELSLNKLMQPSNKLGMV
ncbi:MAG TPA: hypothetical protein PKO15_01650 [Fibrobacteria bacterium]|nr:hypothetical protein [Fibrobacteria bacterium]HOX49862.1 hypothetical protein [Fibrobacteria bacterium]